MTRLFDENIVSAKMELLYDTQRVLALYLKEQEELF